MSDSNSGDTGGSPYGETPPRQNPYGQPPSETPASPYGEQPARQNPYGQQPPYGYGGRTSDKRPGSVTGAAVITLIFSGLSVLIYAFILIALIVAKDEVLDAITQEPDFEDLGISPDSAFGAIVAFVAVFLVWCVVACVLDVLVLRLSNAARITLVVSSAMTAVFSLLSITSLVSAIPLLASIAVIVLLFVGGANDWFKGRNRQATPGMSTY